MSFVDEGIFYLFEKLKLFYYCIWRGFCVCGFFFRKTWTAIFFNTHVIFKQIPLRYPVNRAVIGEQMWIHRWDYYFILLQVTSGPKITTVTHSSWFLRTGTNSARTWNMSYPFQNCVTSHFLLDRKRPRCTELKPSLQPEAGKNKIRKKFDFSKTLHDVKYFQRHNDGNWKEIDVW